jgi:predicted ATP-dependent endonuclease of OLD family
MADKLIVENFGPIKRKTELDIKKTTVLIGPQDSGKSTLAKLVAEFSDKIRFHNLTIQRYKFDFINYNIHDFFTDNTFFEFQNQHYNIFYNNGQFKTILNQQLDEQTKNMMIDYTANTLKMNFNEFAGYVQSLPIKMDSNIRGIGSTAIKEIFTNFDFYSSNYIPAERFLISSTSGAVWGLMNNNIALAPYITQFGSQFEIARTRNPNLSINYLGIHYKYDKGIDTVILNDYKEIKLSVSASGFQSIIPMQLVIENNFKNDLTKFIIEEPELNLFPTTQKNLVQYLVEKCTYSKNELFITTHSPYVLATLNLLTFAYQTAQKHPELIEEIKAIVPQESWINPDEFAAYYVDEGTARSIINPKTGLISDNELDGVSDMIGDEFDALMDIYRKPTHETVA